MGSVGLVGLLGAVVVVLVVGSMVKDVAEVQHAAATGTRIPESWRHPSLLDATVLSALSYSSSLLQQENNGGGSRRQLFADDDTKTYAAGERRGSRYVYFTNKFKLETIEAGLCAKDNVTGECQWPRYLESIFSATPIAIIFAILMLLSCPVFWLGRSTCCGGYKPSVGVMMPGERFEDLGYYYTLKEVTFTKYLASVLSIVALVFAVLGFVGSGAFSTASADFGAALQEAGQKLVDDSSAIQSEFYRLRDVENRPYLANSTAPEDMDGAVVLAQELLERAETVQRYIQDIDAIRHPLVLALFIVSLVLYVCLLVSAWLSIPKLGYVMAILGFLLCALMLIIFSFHRPLGMIMADLCYEIDETFAFQAQHGPGTNNSQTYDERLVNTDGEFADVLEIMLSCASLPPFQLLRTLANNLERTALEAGCLGLDFFCLLNLPCPGAPVTVLPNCPVAQCSNASSTCSISTLQSFKDNIAVADYLLGCARSINPSTFVPTIPANQCGTYAHFQNVTSDIDLLMCDPSENDNGVSLPAFTCGMPFNSLTYCAANCSFYLLREFSRQLLEGASAAQEFEQIKVSLIDPFLTCVPLTSLFEQMQEILCDRLLKSISYIAAGSLGLGVLFVPSIMVALMGTKRFDEKWQEDGTFNVEDVPLDDVYY